MRVESDGCQKGRDECVPQQTFRYGAEVCGEKKTPPKLKGKKRLRSSCIKKKANLAQTYRSYNKIPRASIICEFRRKKTQVQYVHSSSPPG